jgi:hypothetical protein
VIRKTKNSKSELKQSRFASNTIRVSSILFTSLCNANSVNNTLTLGDQTLREQEDFSGISWGGCRHTLSCVDFSSGISLHRHPPATRYKHLVNPGMMTICSSLTKIQNRTSRRKRLQVEFKSGTQLRQKAGVMFSVHGYVDSVNTHDLLTCSFIHVTVKQFGLSFTCSCDHF